MSGIAIIDSGGANIASLKFALQRLGANAEITGDARSICAADRVILPGVGAAANAMQRLRELELTDVIRNLSQPVLGICGILDGRAEQLPGTPELPVPNMGWCPVQLNSDHPVMADIADNSYFYFVHSYAVPRSNHTIASAQHAVPFSAVMASNNFVAAQFHPERSAKAGAKLLQNFLSWSP
jgi:glutamine amidotransferase